MPKFRVIFLAAFFFIGLQGYSSGLFAQYNWDLLSQSPQNGQKQDDVFFITPEKGWSVNGSGRVYRTDNGGDTWDLQLQKSGSYFRCIGFADSLNGFLGNIGPNYFPNVSDPLPLYRTTDGGENWAPVPPSAIDGPMPTGLCAIHVIDSEHIVAAGRVGSPAVWMRSTDGGSTWKSASLSAYIQMITDIYFTSPTNGYIFGGTSPSVQLSKARVLHTTDGGDTWTPIYTGERTFELCWKASFPTNETVYVTLLNYAPNYPERYIAKTTDGGQTWEELPFASNSQKEFGIGFVDELTGWIGTDAGGYETQDGGLTWTSKNIGGFVNKIRLMPNDNSEWMGYAIGDRIYKMTSSVMTTQESAQHENRLGVNIFPNPTTQELNISFELPSRQHVDITLFDTSGRQIDTLFTGELPAGEQTHTFIPNQKCAGIMQVILSTKNYSKVFKVSVLP
ncbi:MAG: T9SS type A sorting domain-containing protein [Mameliella sp.]|nr:T9SS type A sorting domain-containing protein [Phaeodactylibacter sp.]